MLVQCAEIFLHNSQRVCLLSIFLIQLSLLIGAQALFDYVNEI